MTETKQATRIQIDGRTYTAAALDEISLRDLLLFDAQVEKMGLKWRWSDVERVAAAFTKLKPGEIEQHPDKVMFTAVTVWATRRVAGDDITFDEAVSTPLRNLRFLTPTEDRKPGPTKGGAKKKPSRKATRLATAPVAAPAEADESTSTTSESTSETGSSD